MIDFPPSYWDICIPSSSRDDPESLGQKHLQYQALRVQQYMKKSQGVHASKALAVLYYFSSVDCLLFLKPK